MDVDTTTPVGLLLVSREKTAPFLIRTFVKIGGFHRLNLFEDGTLPTTDEHQLYTWKNATLREVLTTLRNAAPHVTELRHPLARFAFRTVYADSGNKGRFSHKDLGGMVYSRDILGEPGTLTTTAARLMEDHDGEVREPTEREKEERTLDELRFVPGDYLLINVILPKNITNEVGIKGAAGAAATATSNGWKSVGRGDGGWGGSVTVSAPGQGRGNGHWRGDSNAPIAGGRGRGGGRGDFGTGRAEGDVGRDRARDGDRADRRIPPPRRGESPPTRGRGGWGDRGGRGARASGRRSRSRSPSRSRSRSRSRTPPPRRRRYD